MKGKDFKPHIGIFGRRNTGKSSFINVLTGQNIAIVSDVAGTTTDPVRKSIEIFGIGPAVVIDTAGIDDMGELGQKRVEKTMAVLSTVDCAILLISGNRFGEPEEALIRDCRNWDVPYLIIHGKSDLEPVSKETRKRIAKLSGKEFLEFSNLQPERLEKVIDSIKKTIPETAYQKTSMLKGIINENDYVLLITPIDNEAPDGRMILPQVMAIRDVLDNNCINIVLKETQVEHFLSTSAITPAIAITDSQIFSKMKKLIPPHIQLTSFSIMLAHFRGDFGHFLEGTPRIDELKEGDRVLIMESCTHQVNCDDIGRYKIPAWLKKHTGKELSFDIVAGLNTVPRGISEYSLVIQCGGCMITRKQLHNRLKSFAAAGIPVTNYGMAIAWMNDIFHQSVKPFRMLYESVAE